MIEPKTLSIDTLEELLVTVKDSQILWRKRLQHSEGRLNVNLGDNCYVFSTDECEFEIKRLKELEEEVYWFIHSVTKS